MKKKLLLLSLLLITLLFMGCDLSSSNSKMTIKNDGTETITGIEVQYNAYLTATSKMQDFFNNSLDDGQVVEKDESVEYELPTIQSNSNIKVRFKSTYIEGDSTITVYKSVSLDIDKDANFTLHYNNHNTQPTITGYGATIQILF